MAHPQHNFTSNFNGSDGHNAELTLNINGVEKKYTPAGNDQTYNVPGVARIDINLDGADLVQAIQTALDGAAQPVLVEMSIYDEEVVYQYIGDIDGQWYFGTCTTTKISTVTVAKEDGAVNGEQIPVANGVVIVESDGLNVYSRLRTALALGQLPVLSYVGANPVYAQYEKTADNGDLIFVGALASASDTYVQYNIYTVASNNTVTVTTRAASAGGGGTPDDENGFFNSSLYTTPGDGVTESLTLNDFRINQGTSIHGSNIEFVPTHQEGGVDFGEVYLNPGTYIFTVHCALQWVGSPRGTFLPLVANVGGQPFDFSYEHEDILRSTRIVTRTTRGKFGLNFPFDADTPPMGIWVKYLEIAQLASNTHPAVVHDTTLAGSGTAGSPLGVTTDAFSKIKDIPTSISQFRNGDVIPVDGPNGPAKMGKDDLLTETAQKPLAVEVSGADSNVAGAYLNNTTSYVNLVNPLDKDAIFGAFMRGANDWAYEGIDPRFSSRKYGESGFIRVYPDETLYIYSSTFTPQPYIACYNSDRELLNVAANSAFEFRVPANVHYIRIPIDCASAFFGGDNSAIYRKPLTENVYHPYRKLGVERIAKEDSDITIGAVSYDEFIDAFGGAKNLLNPNDPDVERGGYRYSDGSWISNPLWSESGFIPFKKGRGLFFYRDNTVLGIIEDRWPQLELCYYDSNKNYVAGGHGDGVFKYLQNNGMANDIAFVRIPIYNDLTDKTCVGERPFNKVVPYENSAVMTGDVRNEFGQDTKLPVSQKFFTDTVSAIPRAGAQWSGKKWYAYGTSITSTQMGKYASPLAQMLGLTLSNKGIPGGGIGNLGATSTGQVFSAICNITDGKMEADLITLETGANDVNASVPLGSVYDETQATLAGCLNLCIRYLQANTDAQIAVMPSVATTDDPASVDWYYNWQKMIEEICAINRVYFIRPACNLGYGKLLSSRGSAYRADSIHQSVLGGYVLAEAMAAQIRQIPIFRTSIPS